MSLSKRETLLALAERAEQATGPDRKFDIEIALSLPAWTYGGKQGRFFNAGPKYKGANDRIGFRADDGSEVRPGGPYDMLVPYFTKSLDAAMQLVPEGWRVLRLDQRWIEGDWCCHLTPQPTQRQVAAFKAGRTVGYETADSRQVATPALALVAACLKAQAEQVIE
jgi:hypothetical protein